ncbi:MAG: hypothetical protein ABI142_13110 [Bryocella sp.]
MIGAILSGWRYDISGIPKDLRSDYEMHLEECAHCRRRQRVHRTVDILLLAVTALSFAAFLLAAFVLHRVEAYTHIVALHVKLHSEAATEFSRIPDSITISLETVACIGVFVSLLLWILVAIATPVPTMLTSMFRKRRLHGRDPEDSGDFHKHAA